MNTGQLIHGRYIYTDSLHSTYEHIDLFLCWCGKVLICEVWNKKSVRQKPGSIDN